MGNHVAINKTQIDNNNRRAIKVSLFGNLNEKQLNSLIDKYFRDDNGNLHCAYTGETIEKQEELALDHIISINRNGGSVIFNVCPTISAANTSKHNYELLSWWKKKENYYDIDRLRNLTMYILEGYNIFFKENNKIETEDILEDTFENVNELKKEKYNKEKGRPSKKLNPIDYKVFLNTLLYELKQNGVTLDNIDKENKHDVDYKKIYEEINLNQYYEGYKERELYQRIIYENLNTYAKEKKYVIAANLDYKNIYENMDELLTEQGVKEENKEIMANYLIQMRMLYLTTTIARQVEISQMPLAILEMTTTMPELLYIPLSAFTEEYIKKLKDNIPIKYKRFQFLIEFYEKNKKWPMKDELYQGENLGAVMRYIRQNHNSLTTEQHKLLLELDPNALKNQIKLKKSKNIDLLIEFYHENNKTWPKQQDKYKGVNIGEFFKKLKNNPQSIEPKQKEELLALDPFIFTRETQRKIELLIEYYNKNGKWPTKRGNNKELGNFLCNIRNRMKSNNEEDKYISLTEKQIQRLLETDPNIFENQRKVKTKNQINLLIEYRNENGKWPTKNVTYKGERIGQYLHSLRQRIAKAKKEGKENTTFIEEEQWNQLLEIDPNIFENPVEIEIDNKVNLLIEFLNENKRRPKQSGELYKNVDIGQFYRTIRTLKLKDDQKKRIMKVDPYIFETDTNYKFYLLIEFRNKNGRWPKKGGEMYENTDINIGYFFLSIMRGSASINDNQKQQLLEIDPTLVIKEKQRVKEIKNLKDTQQGIQEEYNKGRKIA